MAEAKWLASRRRPDLDDVEPSGQGRFAKGVQICLRGPANVLLLRGIDRPRGADFPAGFLPAGLDFHKAKRPGVIPDNQVQFADAMRRTVVAAKRLVAGIFKIPVRGLLA